MYPCDKLPYEGRAGEAAADSLVLLWYLWVRGEASASVGRECDEEFLCRDFFFLTGAMCSLVDVSNMLLSRRSLRFTIPPRALGACSVSL